MIRLTLGISVELKRFAANSSPRSRPNIAQVTYSANGTPLYDGSFYEPPYQWEIEAVRVSDVDRLKLLRIFERSRSQRAEVLLEDYTLEHVDYGDQTREAATGATVVTAGGYNTYYAKFNVLFDSMPVFEIAGEFWRVGLTVKESSLVEA